MSPNRRAFPVLAACLALLTLGSCGGEESATGTDPSDIEAIGEILALAGAAMFSGTFSGAPPPRAALPEAGDSEAVFPDLLGDLRAAERDTDRGAAAPSSRAFARVTTGSCGSGSSSVSCSDGGSVAVDLNLYCTGPSGCCADNPRCSQDKVDLQGDGNAVYDRCQDATASGAVVTADGVLVSTLTGYARVSCLGGVAMGMAIALRGELTFLVNGREVCSGPTDVAVQVVAGNSISIGVSGTVCGEAIDETYPLGCGVDCADGSCCPIGSSCSNCGGCPGLAWVDCCNGTYCPKGTTCTADNRCRAK